MSFTDLEGMSAESDEAVREVLVKAYSVGADGQASNVLRADDANRFELAGGIEPPYDPNLLMALFEQSNSLRPNVDAYATNIDGFGHRLEPVLDVDADDADQRIAQWIMAQRRAGLPRGTPVAEPTEEEVSARKRELVESMRLEKEDLDLFFSTCCETSLVTFRRRIREDREVLGNAYFEVLRNAAMEIAELVYVPAFTMRLMPLDAKPVEVMQPVRVNAFDFVSRPRSRRFRRFVQVYETLVVYFKELGDPRAVSSVTGRVYLTDAELRAAEPSAAPATEIVHLRVHSSRSPYGVPRWMGALRSVVGSKLAEEVNLLYFDNKTVPPMAVLVSGGRLAESTVARLATHLETLKGRANFHKILILEAESQGKAGNQIEHTGKVTIEIKPLTDAQQKDALFLLYDERNIDKVGMAFRMPRLLRGDVRDFNRATADAALGFAEQQVFQPERHEFDEDTVNRMLFPAMGVRFWRFVSNSPVVRDSMQLATVIKDLAVAGVLTPEEARELSADVFNKPLKPIDEAWVKQPLQLTLAGLTAEGGDGLLPFTGEGDEVAATRAPYGDRDADGAPDDQQKQTPPLAVTRTALGSVVTVNEVRQAHGLGPRTLADGSPDPAGELTIEEYKARAQAGMGATGGEAGTTGAPTLTRAQPRLRPPGRPVHASLEKHATRLLALRNALLNAEAGAAAKTFYRAKRAELAHGAIEIPEEVLREAFRPEES